MPDLGERLTRELATRYITVLVVLGALALMSFVALTRVVQGAGRAAELVQLAGDQRALVQQAVFETHRFLSASGDDRKAAGQTLAEVLGRLESGHRRLFGDGADLPETAREVLDSPPWNLDKEMRDFVRFGHAVLLLPDSAAGHKTNLAGVTLRAAKPLMGGLDEASNRFRAEAAVGLDQVIVVQGTGMVVALVVLVFAAFGVFKPMVQRLQTEFAERAAAEARLEESRERLWRLLEESPVGVSVSRRSDGEVVFVNSRFSEILGMGKEEFLGTKARDHYVDEAQRRMVLEMLRRDGRLDDAEVEFRRKDGTPFWSLLTIRSVDFDVSDRVNLAWIYDITERKAAEQQILLAGKVLETVTEAVVITDADNRILFVNPAFTTITEYTKDEVLGRDPSFLQSGRHDPGFYKGLWVKLMQTGHWEGEIWNRRKSGAFYAEWLSINALRDVEGAVTHYVAVFSDITHRKEDEERIWRQANFDALTGLPNRSLFLDRLQQAVLQSRREKRRFALMFLDLDGFKAVNDSLGHAAGDLLLQQTASRMAGCMRATDTLARLAGDEFVVILEGIRGRDDPALVAGKILSLLSRPYDLDVGTAEIRGSIGIALFPDDADDGPDMIRAADSAMYAVKRSGKNNFIFAADVAEDEGAVSPGA